MDLDTYHIGHGYLGQGLDGSRKESRNDGSSEPLSVGLDMCTVYIQQDTNLQT